MYSLRAKLGNDWVSRLKRLLALVSAGMASLPLLPLLADDVIQPNSAAVLRRPSGWGDGPVKLADGSVWGLSNQSFDNEIRIATGDTATIFGNATLAGPLSGGGDLRHEPGGAFNLTLRGDNRDFSGNIINASTISIGHRNSLGSAVLYMMDGDGVHSSLAAAVDLKAYDAVPNNVVLQDTIQLGASNRTGDFELSGVLSGEGGLIVNHPLVEVTLAGENTYTGLTEIARGRLVVNGSVQSPLITASSGTSLGGTGRVQSVWMRAGSALALGEEAPGTMDFSGDLNFEAGSTSVMKIASSNWFDRLRGSATSTISINGKVLLDFTFNPDVTAGSVFDLYALYPNWSKVMLGDSMEFATQGLPGGFGADFSTTAADGIVRIVEVPAPPPVLPEEFPISMTYHGPWTGGNTVAQELSKYEPVEIMGSIARTMWDPVSTTFPGKMLLKQDAWGGSMSLGRAAVFPGYWLLRAGTKLASGCSESATVLHVEDFRRLVGSQADVERIRPNNASYLLMYALDEEGEPDWTRSEHLRIKAVDTVNGMVTVDRAQLGSAPLALEAGRAVVARHMMFWNDSRFGQWQLNFSLQCPRGGPFHLNAAEWFARRMKKLIDVSGADGIEFDVARWQYGSLAHNTMDCDNDLLVDYGYIDGVQSFGLGGAIFLKELRYLLGPSKIIQMDSNGPGMQRARKYVNGVQLESFPNANRFDQFSDAFLHFRRWTEEAGALPRFSYAYVKTPTTTFGGVYDEEGKSTDWHFRTGFAAGLIAGMPSPFSSIQNENFNPVEFDPLVADKLGSANTAFFKWDEYVGGDLEDWKWLGRPLGDAVQVFDHGGAVNLLEHAEWSWRVEPGFTADCSVSDGVYTTQILELEDVASVPPVRRARLRHFPATRVPMLLRYGTRLEISTGAPELIAGQEYTIEFEAAGNDDWDYAGQQIRQVPRALSLLNPQGDELSVLVDSEWHSFRLSFFAEDTSIPLTFGASEQTGWVSVRNIRLYEGGAERWMRKFENGQVYLNMTREDWRVDVDSGGLRRLSGDQNPQLHNGERIKQELVVPSWDAVFLRSEVD